MNETNVQKNKQQEKKDKEIYSSIAESIDQNTLKPEPVDHYAQRYTITQVRKYLKERNATGAKWSGITIGKDGSLYKNGKMIIIYETIPVMLDILYNNPEIGLKSSSKLWHLIKDKFIGVMQEDVESYVRNNETSQLHKPRVKANVVKPIITKNKDKIWHIDLVDLSKFASMNNNYSWLLAVVDSFTSYAYVVPLKNKEGNTVANGFQSVLSKAGPNHLVSAVISDNGSEFKSNDFERLLESKGIDHIYTTPYNPRANGRVERFNRTFKTLLYRYMTNFNTRHYLGQLDKLVTNYNETYHSSLKTTPEIAYNSNSEELHKRISAQKDVQASKWMQTAEDKLSVFPELQQGDYVRLYAEANKQIRRNATFRKGFEKTWSDEIYRIAFVDYPKKSSKPIVYHLMTDDGEILENIFYRDQLQLIDLQHLKQRPNKSDEPDNPAVFNKDKFLRNDLPNRPIVQEESLSDESEEEVKRRTKRTPKPNKKYQDYV